MKKILLLLISLTILYFWDGVYASDFSTGWRWNYIVEDNTKDGMHDSMADRLIDIGSNYLDGTISPEEARRQLSEYINQVSGGDASAEAHFDSNGGLHIGCTNNGSLIVLRPIGGWSWLSSSWGPPPVTCSASQYTTYNYSNWSACNVGANLWSESNTISCTQTRSVTPQNNPCSVCSDGTSSCSPSETPGPSSQNQTLSFNFSSLTYSPDAYADNSSKITITIPITAPAEWINWNGRTFTNFQDTTVIKSNRIDNSWDKALSLSWIIGWSWNNQLILDIKSIAPVNTNQGKISFQEWTKTFNVNNVLYHFKKPFTWYIKTWDDIKNNWEWSASIGTQNKYKLLLTQKSSLTWSGLSDYTMNDFSSQIEPNWADLEIESKSVNWSTLTSETGTEFSARINTSVSATDLNQTPWLQINRPIVSYKLWWKTVKYYLSEQDGGNDMTPIKTTGSEFMWVRVIGGIQWAGKSEFTWQQANISNLYNSEQRTLIRKAAYEYVKNMSSGQIINGVKYVQWDEKISNITPDVETLVVVDGNVIFDENFIPTQLKWIIVLKDNYDVSTGYTGKGNIYIMPNVSQINAIIYADGGLISVNASGVPYVQDSIERTQALKNQLFLNGSIFTRNTIGWGILAWGEYILPGWTKTQNFDIAMIYDLNYIRRANVWCDKNSNNNCTDSWEYKDPFVIKYDTRVQSNPPKLFAQ